METNLVCPSCKITFAKVTYDDLTVDVCLECKSIWFDNSEEIYSFLSGIRQSTKAINRGFLVSRTNDHSQNKICPKCDVLMDAKFTNYKIRGIHLDSCSKYHGIWAGPGTLKKVRPESEEIKTDTETLGRAIIQELREREDWFAIGTFSNQLITNGYGFTVIFPFANDMRDGNFLVNIGIALTSLITFLYSIYGHPTHSFFVKYALIPKHVMVNWIDPGLVTSQFLHAGWTHLIGNMYFLGIFGPKLEARLGHLRYLLVYILFGALTGLIYSGLHHNSDTMNVGASGSISVLMGAYVTFYPRSRIKILVAGNFTEIPSWLYLAFWFTFQAFHAILFLGAGGEVRVAYSAHIIGFCLGLVYGKWLDIDKDST